MKSVMGGSHSFSQVPKATIPRSQFNRSHGYKTTFDSGYLILVLVDEALPGDTFNLKSHMLARLSTPITPFMDNLFLETFFFAVPYRLVWSSWEKFNGAQDNPGDSTSYLVPTCQSPASGYVTGSLQDYMGIPTVGQVGAGKKTTHNNLHMRAYNLIWNTWFRDQNLQNSVTVDTGAGPDTYTNYVILRRGKRHDYFTSCLPWPQKGTAVTIPLGTSAPVWGDTTAAGTGIKLKGITSGTHGVISSTVAAGTSPTSLFTDGGNWAVENLRWGTAAEALPTGLMADLSSATAATINQLRQSFQIQKLYERDARGGTRYTEIIKSHFGVTSPDARLQRPEYLGGGSQRISINPVVQSSVTAATPQGNLAAFGVGQVSGHGFVKSFTEHCLILGLVNVRADLTYQQGLNKMWSRQTRFDYYWPALSHIGEQAVLNQEIYQVDDSAAQDTNVFGYQERYAEYRYKPSQITGQFRSTYATPLDTWHLSQKFTSLPALNSTFISDTPPLARVLAVPVTGAQMYLDCYFDYKTARPMPTYGVPGLIDHF